MNPFHNFINSIKYIGLINAIIFYLDKAKIINLSDKKYIELMYKVTFGKDINLNNPKSFNEKLNWLKLNDRKEIYTTLVDKYDVKKYVANIIGDQYIIHTIGVYNNFNDIDFSELPNQFVIKTTHDSGSVIICKDINKFNKKEAKKVINKSLKKDFFRVAREWPYKNIKPRIIIEKYMEDDLQKELVDYKFYCFNGKCDYVMACFDRFSNGVKYIYFDKNWKIKKEFSKDGIKYGDNVTLAKPKNLNQMFEIAKKLSENIPFVRVDLYNVNGNIYFGELTLYPSGGFDNTRTKDVEKYLDKKLVVGSEII